MSEQLAIDLADSVKFLARVGERLLDFEGARVRGVELRTQRVRAIGRVARSELFGDVAAERL
ncbi:MAG: hypothetical protein LC777_07440 [Actinobacteria bacterium]|nr:hypothetical protein [Actinomycetota bacterium]